MVETEEGEQVLIPFVEDFIVDIDKAEGVIYMDLPAGLVDMSKRRSSLRIDTLSTFPYV